MTVNGKLVDMRGNYMQIQLKETDPWVFQIKVSAKDMQVKGTAEPGWVQKGMYVSFTAELNDKKVSQTPVTNLMVFTRQESIEMGVTKEEEALDFTNEASEETPASTKYSVIGKVTAKSRDGKLIVTSGRERVTIELAEDAAVTFELSDPRLIRKGDKIEGAGWYYEKGKGIMDKNMTVTSAEPLKGPEVKKRSTSSKKTEEAPKNIFDMK